MLKEAGHKYFQNRGWSHENLKDYNFNAANRCRKTHKQKSEGENATHTGIYIQVFVFFVSFSFSIYFFLLSKNDLSLIFKKTLLLASFGKQIMNLQACFFLIWAVKQQQQNLTKVLIWGKWIWNKCVKKQ